MKRHEKNNDKKKENQRHLTGRFSKLFVQKTFYNLPRFSSENYHLVFSWNEKSVCCFCIDKNVVLYHKEASKDFRKGDKTVTFEKWKKVLKY